MNDIVELTTGPVRGRVFEDFSLFQGIPYAAPPTGELRWRAPQPVQPWTEVRDATNPYFQDAPTGEIFSEAAGQIPDAAIGPRDQTIQEQFTNGLVQIERQGVSPDQAWDNVLSELENALAE